MNFKIETPVAQNPVRVFAQFNQDLFMALKPPLMPLKLLRFDGCKIKDEVHVQLMGGILFHSLITDSRQTASEIYFVDEGILLPFFLKSWKHQHSILTQENGGALIVDDITFKSPFWLFDYLLFPIMYLQFYYRKPIYKRYFC